MSEENNQQFADIVHRLLQEQFGEYSENVSFYGEPGSIEVLDFDGRTNSGKRFWGHLVLAETVFQLIEMIEIHIGGKSGLFGYQPESENVKFNDIVS